jgi:hypothetical protein
MFWYLYIVHNERAYTNDLVSGGRVRYGITKPFVNLSFNETAYIRGTNCTHYLTIHSRYIADSEAISNRLALNQ